MWKVKRMIIPVITGATGIRSSNRRFKETFGSSAGKTCNRFSTKSSYAWNITHNTESTAGCNLKPERWGSLLVQ
jgi:hypothetical protein